MAQVGHLNDLQEKYFDKGLRVVAISDEPLGLIEKKMLEEKGAKYWIGSNPGKSSMGNFSDPGGIGGALGNGGKAPSTTSWPRPSG